MKVTLDIRDDEELRNYIKECIKGQVLSIVRSDFYETLTLEIQRKIDSFKDNKDFNLMIKKAFDVAANNLIQDKNNESYPRDFAHSLAVELLTKKIEDRISNFNWDKAIDDLAKIKIRELINK